ncbi:L-2-amino-thiazoline-4-carboxylic acid hydrolase [Bacteroidota bacterium]
MKNKIDRRKFLLGIAPVCAMSCMLSNQMFAANLDQIQEKTEKPDHKFDETFGEMSYRQLSEVQTRMFVDFAKSLEETLGKEKVSEYIKGFSRDLLLARGKAQAAKAPDLNLQSYVGQFKNNPIYKNALSMEIIEDTDKVFEMKISECLSATTFRAKDASEIGYACICHGDYAWAEGFNPEIKLIRDKTLMQGHDCCNHRYTIST